MNTNLKTVIVIVSALAIVATPAIASKRPPTSTIYKGLIGSWAWCEDYHDEDCLHDHDPFIIYPTFYRGRNQGSEYVCNFTVVKTYYDHNIDANTKEKGGYVSRVTADCINEDCTWKDQTTMFVNKGHLINNPRHYQLHCRGESR
jgi:hypothetical protein